MKLYISALQKLVHSGDSCNDVGRPFDVLTVHRANDQKLCVTYITCICIYAFFDGYVYIIDSSHSFIYSCS